MGFEPQPLKDATVKEERVRALRRNFRLSMSSLTEDPFGSGGLDLSDRRTIYVITSMRLINFLGRPE